jgi:methylaspartate ammonia-lyase
MDLLEDMDVDGIKVLTHKLINSMEELGFNSFA